jgi:hypothetical protein
VIVLLGYLAQGVEPDRPRIGKHDVEFAFFPFDPSEESIQFAKVSHVSLDADE